MAGLEPSLPHSAASAPATIPASQQFAAVAFLRARLFLNGFRRKGGTGELAARLITYPLFAAFAVLPILAAGYAAYAAVSNGRPQFLGGIFWAVTVLQIVVSINIAPPGLSFDPESLIRFPLSFPRYLVIRLFLGLLSASTLVGTVALLSLALGVTIAASSASPVASSLVPVAFAAAFTLALSNMIFTRMVFAWVDRWLSTRRARELFTALIFTFSIGVQYLNVTFNGVGRHTGQAGQQAKVHAFLHIYNLLRPVLNRLPPGLAGASLYNALTGHPAGAVLDLLGILLFAALFLAVFAWRMQREYRGENLSETARSTTPTEAARVSHLPADSRQPQVQNSRTVDKLGSGQPPALLSPAITACLHKEWIYVRRNPTQFYGLLAPLAMVFLFAGRIGNFARTGLSFPAAILYSTLGIAALAYNSLGIDAAGVQFYFLAPVTLRSVLVAKNLFSFAITTLQVTLVFVVLTLTSGRPPLLITLSTVAWVFFAALVNVTFGNVRSITAPKKIDPSKFSRRQTSQLSALISIGLMLSLAALGFGLLALGRVLHRPWLPLPILLALALAAFVAYRAGLDRVDALALHHRETILEELTKVSA